jgi:hypothetical protein
MPGGWLAGQVEKKNFLVEIFFSKYFPTVLTFSERYHSSATKRGNIKSLNQQHRPNTELHHHCPNPFSRAAQSSGKRSQCFPNLSEPIQLCR